MPVGEFRAVNEQEREYGPSSEEYARVEEDYLSLMTKAETVPESLLPGTLTILELRFYLLGLRQIEESFGLDDLPKLFKFGLLTAPAFIVLITFEDR